jgi:hypothetical protein
MIKEFLKPNLGKIILTIGFGLIAYYFGWNECGGASPFKGAAQPAVCWEYYNPIFWGPLAYIDVSVIEFPVANLTIERWISGIVYWYLIASAIIFVYSILKKGKANKFI